MKPLWTMRGLNFSYYATTAVLMPFLPLYFEQRGYSSAQIGILMTAGPFVTMFAQPLWGYLSDRYQTLKLIILGLWLMTIASSAGIFQTTQYSFALLFMLLLYFFMQSSVPLMDTLAIKAARQAGASYGSVRMFGSLGFTLMAISSGPLLMKLGGLDNIPYVYWTLWLLPLALLMLLQDEKGTGPRISLAAVGSVLGNRRFLWFLLLVFLMTVPHRMNDGMFVLYLKDLGAADAMAGWAWAIAAASEVPTFALLGRYLHKFHELALLGIVAVLYTVRWVLYSLVEDPALLMGLQSMHMVTFAVFWIVAVQYAVRLVPPELVSTGQAMLSAVFLGMAGITGGAVGGWIKDMWGGQAMYQSGAVMTLVAAVLLLGTHALDRRKTPHRLHSQTLGRD